jgi:hypothetical protein
MPIYTTRIPVARVSGKLTSSGTPEAIIVTSPPRQAPAMRRHCLKTKPPTTAQALTRNYIGQSAKAFHALDQADADAWRAAADTLSRTNALGARYWLGGINLFQQVNYYRQLNGLTITETPPALTNIPPPPSVTYLVSGAPPQFYCFAECQSAVDGCFVLFRITTSSSNQARQRQKHEARIPTANPQDAFATFTAGIASLLFTPTEITLTAGQYVGLSSTLLSPFYVPRAPIWEPLKFITP